MTLTIEEKEVTAKIVKVRPPLFAERLLRDRRDRTYPLR
jgi:hypothetical protein